MPLAPRNVPHVWTHLHDWPGRMLVAFTPAAKAEDFFVKTSRLDAVVGDQRKFEAHGMKYRYDVRQHVPANRAVSRAKQGERTRD